MPDMAIPKGQGKWQPLYEWTFAVLAVFAVVLAVHEFWPWLPDWPWLELADHGILAIFVVDYLVRLVKAPAKWTFVRSHPWDLLAIMPGHSVMRGFRLFRLARFTRTLRVLRAMRLLRIAALGRRAYPYVRQFLRTNGIGYVLCFTMGLVLVGAVGIFFAEDRTAIAGFGDALWWSFVTTTTVGYGDISPASALGRAIAVVLMLTGIGTLGMLTGSIATFFLRPKEVSVPKDGEALDTHGLSSQELALVQRYIDFLRSEP